MDLVSDSLTRIKNGYLAKRHQVDLSYSKFVKSVCEVLKAEGYIVDYKEVKAEKDGQVRSLLVQLRYDGRKPALTDVKRVSKPGLRIYKGKKFLPYVLNGLGIAIISTPRGVMTDKKARKEGLGGEIVALVW